MPEKTHFSPNKSQKKFKFTLPVARLTSPSSLFKLIYKKATNLKEVSITQNPHQATDRELTLPTQLSSSISSSVTLPLCRSTKNVLPSIRRLWIRKSPYWKS